MDKLEKLENLYQEFWEDEFKKKGIHNPAKFIDTQPFMYRSKELGFIKWLVDNDKIDREKIDGLKLIPTLTYQNMIDDCDCGKSHWHPYTFAGYVDELLMLLAISNAPIDDLISYLK